MRFVKVLLIKILLLSFVCFAFSVKKEKVKKPRGLQNSVHDDYVKCKEECRKIEEREITEKYIQYLKTELEAAQLVVVQEQAALQSTISASTNHLNENELNKPVSQNNPSRAGEEAAQKETSKIKKQIDEELFVQEESLIV